MISPITALEAWLKADPAWAGYAFDMFRGIWNDSTANANKRLCALMSNGGRAPIAANYDVVSLIMLGPRNGRADAPALEAICTHLRQRLETDFAGCDVAQIRLLSGIVGPGYTAETRPWYELQFEVTT